MTIDNIKNKLFGEGLWPVVLYVDDIGERGIIRPDKQGNVPFRMVLRDLILTDEEQWVRLREEDRDWLAPWESTLPPGWMASPQPFKNMMRQQYKQGRNNEVFPFIVELDGQIVGSVTGYPILRGPSQSVTLGYWVSESVAGRGVITAAVARVCDFCFFERGLHRVEINIKPDNERSIRVVEKLGFREEGYKKDFLHINGQWADHISYALTIEEVYPQGMMGRLAEYIANRDGRDYEEVRGEGYPFE